MKKVFYAVTRVGKTENVKMSGMGFITDTDLVIACMSRANKPYVKVFEDVIQCCHPMVNKTDEFNGAFLAIKRKIRCDMFLNSKMHCLCFMIILSYLKTLDKHFIL